MDDFDLPWLRPAPPPSPPRSIEPPPEMAEPTAPPVPMRPPPPSHASVLPPNLPLFLSPNASAAARRPSASQPPTASSQAPLFGRQLLGPYHSAHSVPIPPNPPSRSSSSLRPPIPDYEAPLPQTDSRIAHFRQQSMLNNAHRHHGSVTAVKTTKKKITFTVAILPLSVRVFQISQEAFTDKGNIFVVRPPEMPSRCR